MKFYLNILLVSLVVAIIGLSAFIYKKVITKSVENAVVAIKNGVGESLRESLPDPSPTVKPTPIPLTKGVGMYSIGQSDKSGPLVSQVVFNPLDVQKGQTLKLSVKISFSQPVSEVKAVLKSDNSEENLEFKLVTGSTTDGEWASSLPLKDSVLYRYILTITAKSGDKATSITVAPRS